MRQLGRRGNQRSEGRKRVDRKGQKGDGTDIKVKEGRGRDQAQGDGKEGIEEGREKEREGEEEVGGIGRDTKREGGRDEGRSQGAMKGRGKRDSREMTTMREG